jgi:5-methyltetrahydrofolate--homocysteine methyltransferase
MNYQTIFNGIIEGDQITVQTEIRNAINNGFTAQTILDEALIPSMEEVGHRYEKGEIFVPEMLVAALAMKGALEVLRPQLVETGVKPVGVVALGTVQGDLHDIGKNLVSLMLQGAGFEVRDLGVDVHPDKFVHEAKEGAQVLGMSALLTTTMPAIKRSILALEEAGIRDRVKVIIGGAPITSSFTEEAGADAFAPDAASAVRTTKTLLSL